MPFHVHATVWLCATLLLTTAPGCSEPSYKSQAMGELHSAALRGDVETARNLLDAGANVNEKDGRGRTPLHCAADANSPEMIQLLLERGADPTLVDHTNSTPLDQADKNGQQDAFRILQQVTATAQ